MQLLRCRRLAWCGQSLHRGPDLVDHTLEGIGLSANDDYSIVSEAFPYLSQRLLTDDSPRAKAPSRSPSPATVAFDLTHKLDGEDVLFALDV